MTSQSDVVGLRTAPRRFPLAGDEPRPAALHPVPRLGSSSRFWVPTTAGEASTE
jgi:hypothetical protein